MKRKVLITLATSVVLILIAWFGNIILRSVQFAREELTPDWRYTRTNRENCSSGASDLAEYARSIRFGDPVSFESSFPETIDADGDGISAYNEMLQFNSDSSIDSDSDGIPDNQDNCHNCTSITFRDRIETLLVTEIICNWAADKDRVYVIATDTVDPSFDCPDTNFVVLPPWAFDEISSRPGTLPPDHSPDYGVCKLEPRLYVPGLIYAYYFDYVCGPLCAEWSYAFVLDIPFVGPVYVGRKTLGVS